MTLLDQAHAAMQANPANETASLQFYRLLADATLFLLLEHEANGAQVTPRVFDLEGGPVMLAFDSEERLASLGDGPQPYAALPGRVIAGQMAGQGLTLGLNLGTDAPSEMLLPPEALDWLMAMLDQTPTRTEARPEAFHAPTGLPEALALALEMTFAGSAGLATGAMLAGVRYVGGGQGHMLAVLDADPQAEAPLARAVAEVLAFSGLEAAGLDVTFLSSGDPVLATMAQVARVFAIPEMEEPLAPTPTGPGMDPARPPRLR